MIMSLGFFVFSFAGTPVQKITRSDTQDWASNKRIGQRPAHQHIGQGNDVISIDGTLYPSHTDGVLSLDVLREMKNSGSQYLLITGHSRTLGAFFIKNIQETQTYFLQTGEARKIEFKLELIRGDINRVDQIGDNFNSIITPVLA